MACSKRRVIGTRIFKRIFKKYHEFVPAEIVIDRVHKLIYLNKSTFKSFPKSVKRPLSKISADKTGSKRYIICFLRQLAKIYKGNNLVYRKKSIYNDKKKIISVYEYSLVKVD